MPKITTGIAAKLTKEGAKDIDLVVHRYLIERLSPCAVIENGANLGLTGGHIESIERFFQSAVDKHPGYTIRNRATIEMEVPDQMEEPAHTDT